MVRPARVVEVEHLGAHRLRLTFSDGFVRELDFRGAVERGVLTSLIDPRTFALVTVDPVAGTICWPNGIDLDPDVLHGDQVPATGRPPTVIKEYRLRATG